MAQWPCKPRPSETTPGICLLMRHFALKSYAYRDAACGGCDASWLRKASETSEAPGARLYVGSLRPSTLVPVYLHQQSSVDLRFRGTQRSNGTLLRDPTHVSGLLRLLGQLLAPKDIVCILSATPSAERSLPWSAKVCRKVRAPTLGASRRSVSAILCVCILLRACESC